MAFWHIFQKTADRIQRLELPKDVKEFLQKLSDTLPDKLVKGFVGFVEKLYKRNGKEIVTSFLEKLIASLKKILL